VTRVSRRVARLPAGPPLSRARVLPRLAVLLPLLSVSCITQPPGFTFAVPATGSSEPIDRVLWVERVEIADDSVAERELTEIAFTYNLVRYLRQQKLFRRVRVTPPGTVMPGDWVARMRIERMAEGSGAPGDAIALSLATLGLYAYFGRPLEARSELAAELELRDGSGMPIARKSDLSSQSKRFRSRDFQRLGRYLVERRTRLIDALVAGVLDAQEEQREEREGDEAREPDDDEQERVPEDAPEPPPVSEEEETP
jgi:hypothetical protein